jgi:hypothetical protein
MARSLFQRTEAQADVSGFLMALAGIEVGVYVGGSYGTVGQALGSIYQARTGTAQGPAPEASASGGPNPFSTGASGASEFWLDAGFYDVHIRDTHVPARIPERTIQHMAVPAVAGGIPGSWLGKPSGDAGVEVSALSDVVLRQVAPIGQVIKWWRPTDAIALPGGWEIADGRVIGNADHDFPIASAITLPDLRNKFVLGADVNKPDGTLATLADAASNSPGIRGAGGSQVVALSAAQSGVNGNGSVAAAGSHNHGGVDGEVNLSHYYNSVNTGLFLPASSSGFGVWIATGGNHSHVITSDGSHGHTMNARNADATHSNVPQYVGLLMLIKVRRA